MLSAGLLKDLNTANGGISPEELTDVNGTLYYVANVPGTTSNDIWLSIAPTFGMPGVTSFETPFTIPERADENVLQDRHWVVLPGLGCAATCRRA